MELEFRETPHTPGLVPKIEIIPEPVGTEAALNSSSNTTIEQKVLSKSRLSSASSKIIKSDTDPVVKLAVSQFDTKILREKSDLIEVAKISEMIAKKMDSFTHTSLQIEFASCMLHILTRADSMSVAIETLELAKSHSKKWPKILLLDETKGNDQIDQPLNNKLLAKLDRGESLTPFEVLQCKLLDVTDQESQLLEVFFKKTKWENLTTKVMGAAAIAFYGVAAFGTYTGLYQLPYEVVIGAGAAISLFGMPIMIYHSYKVNKIAHEMSLIHKNAKTLASTPNELRRSVFNSTARHLMKILNLAKESECEDPQIILEAEKSLRFVSICSDIFSGRRAGLQKFNSLLDSLNDYKEQLIAFDEVDSHILDTSMPGKIEDVLGDLTATLQFAERSYEYREYLGINSEKIQVINADIEKSTELLETIKRRSTKLRSANALNDALGEL